MATVAARAPQGTRAWPPALHAAADDLARPLARGRDEDLLPAARLPRRARGHRADDPGAGARRLRPGRPPVGGRDARLHAGHGRDDRARAARTHQRARGHERRREDGQEDGLPRQAGAAARAEGPRSRRARRRAAQPLARPRHERRPARRHQRARHEHLRAARGQRRAQREQPALGARQLDAHVRNRRLPAAEEGRLRGAERRSRAASGARRRTMPAGSIATRTSRCCTSISSRRRTSRATRTWCAPAAATSRSAARTTK